MECFARVAWDELRGGRLVTGKLARGKRIIEASRNFSTFMKSPNPAGQGLTLPIDILIGLSSIRKLEF